MLGKLLSRFQKNDSTHPLGSDANVEALLRDIPAFDPAHLLLDIDHWLVDMAAHAQDIGAAAAMRAVVRLDQHASAAAAQLLVRYLKSGQRDYLSESLGNLLDRHAELLFECHLASLRALGPALATDDDRQRLARCAARALRAWALRKLLLRCRYRQPAPDYWQAGHELLRLVAPWGLLPLKVVAYRDEAPTTALQEYLIAVYFELAPVSNLTPPQLPVVEAFLRHAEVLDLATQAGEASAHCIDLAAAAGPRRRSEDAPAAASLRYLSIARLRAPLMKLALQIKRRQDMPLWVGALPANLEQSEGALLALVMHWGPAPPQRKTDRVALSNEIRAVFGFDLARRMVACAHFARMGRSLRYESADINKLFNESRFGSLSSTQLAEAARLEREAEQAAADADAAVDPLATLRALETTGDQSLMEQWRQVDASATGLGALVPTVLARHRIGALVCVRAAEAIDWRLGIIRRLGRDGQNRPSIGVAFLGRLPMCIQAKPVGSVSIWHQVSDGGHGWLDAILADIDSQRILLAAGSFAANLEVDVRGEGISWKIRLVTLLEHGSDYELIEFQRIDTP